MRIKVDASLDMGDAGKILNGRGLEKGGKVQRFIATNIIRVTDPYVPLRSGVLKGSATRNNAAPYEEITYDGPYARRLYYNPQYKFNGAPKRGGYWFARAWADNKDSFLADLQRFVDGGGL